MTGQGRYLFGTDVLSKTRKPRANQGVIAFVQSTEPTSAFISVLTIGELRKGVAAKRFRNPDLNAAARLSAWADGLELNFADRILGIDTATARLRGEWCADRPRPAIDTLLAAAAVLHDLTLVTRNLRDVQGLPVKLLDPWTE